MADVYQHEEAAKALQIGKVAVDAGQYEKAVKMLEKSLRMRKTAEAEALLACAQKGLARADAKKNPEPVTPSSSSNQSSSTNADRPFTPEQVQACRVVLECKTHYETLSVDKTASVEEIKKSYRKLALKFHPDKNSAPQADEAFKKISKAFKILIDADERAHYDRYGETDDTPRPQRNHFHRHGGGFHQDMDPDDLLRWFMSGGVMGGGGGPFGPNIRMHHFGGRPGGGFGRGAQAQAAPDTTFPFQQLFSFLLMLFFLLSSWSPSADYSTQRSAQKSTSQIFSLFPESTYSTKRTTAMHGVVPDIPYYVDSRFASSIGRSPRDLYYVERNVESALHQTLKEKCQSEIHYKTEQVNKARVSRDGEALGRAMKLEQPNCIRQQEFEKLRGK